MKNLISSLKILFLTALIILGLWFFDYTKSHGKTFDVQMPATTTTTKDASKELLTHIYSTPISYVINDSKSILIDLTNMNLFLLKNGHIYRTIKVLHKGPSTLWFQSPTNYFNIGVKYTLLKSGIVNVYMPYSVQIHQDFFVHGIPYFPDGTRVTSKFSGGCLRLADTDAKAVYDFADRNNKIVVFETAINNSDLKENFYSPIDSNRYWIRQSYNSPLKINGEYLQHSGVDMSTKEPENVKAIYEGTINTVVVMGSEDAGFGNTVIIEHNINDEIVYSLYAHLESINKDISIGKKVKGGDIIGVTGASGYGCQNYWRIGKDGCTENDFLDRHLHLEIKTQPTLTNSEGGDDCLQKNGDKGPCYGYSPKNPNKYGYIDPIKFITK